MTQRDFLSELQKGLRTLPFEEQRDILRDYESHFAEGHSMGKTEDEIAARLGNPLLLAEEYCGDKEKPASAQARQAANTVVPPQPQMPQPPIQPPYGANTQRAGTAWQMPPPAPGYPAGQSTTSQNWSKFLGVFLLVIAVLFAGPFLIAFLSVVYSLPLATLSVGIALTVGSVFSSGTMLAGLICLQIAMYGFTVALLVFAIYVTKWTVWLCRGLWRACKGTVKSNVSR